MGNRAVTLAANILFNSYISDLETCFKLLPLPLYRELDIRSAGFGMEAELTARLLPAGSGRTRCRSSTRRAAARTARSSRGGTASRRSASSPGSAPGRTRQPGREAAHARRQALTCPAASSPAAPASSARTCASACSARATRCVCLDNFLTGGPAQRRAPAWRTRRFRLVRCDVTDYVHVPGPVDLRAALRLAGQPDRLPEAADRDAQGRLARHAARARPGQGEGRPVPARLHQRGLRRPAGAPAARGLLGQRQPGRARAASTTRPSASPRP